MVSPLLKGKASIRRAEKTFDLAVSALKKGDARLAVSRAITAVIIAARSGQKKKADLLIKKVRKILQGMMISRMADTVAGLSGRVKSDLFLKCQHPEVMVSHLARNGVPFDGIEISGDGIIVRRKYVPMARKVLISVTGGRKRTILKVS